jgi:seryl-tRNA synthetase
MIDISLLRNNFEQTKQKLLTRNKQFPQLADFLKVDHQ